MVGNGKLALWVARTNDESWVMSDANGLIDHVSCGETRSSSADLTASAMSAGMISDGHVEVGRSFQGLREAVELSSRKRTPVEALEGVVRASRG